MKSENNASFYNRGPEDGHLNGLLTAHEVSQMLRIPLSTVYHLTSVGKLQAVRIGKHWRYHRSEVDKFLFGPGVGTNSSHVILNPKGEGSSAEGGPASGGQDSSVTSFPQNDNRKNTSRNDKNNIQKRKSPRLNTHLPCQFEIIIPGWKKIVGVAAIRKISEEGVYLRKIEILDSEENNQALLEASSKDRFIEPDDPIVLRFHLLGEITGRVLRLDHNPVQGGQNGPWGVAIAFRHLPEEVKQKIREFIG